MECIKIKHISDFPIDSGYYLVLNYYNRPSIYYFDNQVLKWYWCDELLIKKDQIIDDNEININPESSFNLIYIDIPIDLNDYRDNLKNDWMFL